MKNVFDFDANMKTTRSAEQEVSWYNAKLSSAFAVFGSDAVSEEGFCRLTRSERDMLRPINEGNAWLGEHSSGIQIRFVTDSSRICLRVKLRDKFNMTNMTQVGQCGADLYVYDETMQAFVLHEVARYPFDATEYELSLSHFAGAARKMRKYVLYLPLYMAVDNMGIGLDENACVHPLGFSSPLRIAVYGTSIVQGCSASRPGTGVTNILSRELDAEVYNFGFSGCAYMEKEMGELLGSRKKFDCLIVDAEPNAGIDVRMQQNAQSFFNAFYALQPSTPVIVFSRVPFAMDLYDEYRVRLHTYYNGFLRDSAARYRRKGYRMRFADGSKLFKGNFTEYTVDGIHPTDTGMYCIARAYMREIRRALTK